MNRRTFFHTTVGALLAGFLPRPKSPLFRAYTPRPVNNMFHTVIPMRKMMARIRVTEEVMRDAQPGVFLNAYHQELQNIARDIQAREEWYLLGSTI